MREEATCAGARRQASGGQWAAQFKTPSGQGAKPGHSYWEPLAAWRLVTLPRDGHLPSGQPRPFRRHQVRIPRIRLDAPIEDHVLAADVRHSQRPVAHHGIVYEFEDGAKTGAREEWIAAGSACKG